MNSSTMDLNQLRRGKKMDVPESSIKRRRKYVFRSAPTLLPEPSATPLDLPLIRIPIFLRKDGSFCPHDPKFQKGTTALAFIFEEGIMVAADYSSKSSKSTKNIVELNSHMLGTVSGGSEFLLNELQKECSKQEQKEGRKTSVEDALKWLAKTIKNCNKELSIGILIAAWNESKPCLYYINGKGEVVEGNKLATGSGSVAALTSLDEHAPFSYTHTVTHSYGLRSRRKCSMSVGEAAELAKNAVCDAACIAPHSGEFVSVYHVGRGGCFKLLEVDVKEWEKANYEESMKFEVIGEGW